MSVLIKSSSESCIYETNSSIFDDEIIRRLVMKNLNIKSICSLELVCKKWNLLFKNCLRWRYFLIRMVKDSITWSSLSMMYEWNEYIYYNPIHLPPEYFRSTIHKCVDTLKKLKSEWVGKLENPKCTNINLNDTTDEILCFSHSPKSLYIGHKNSKITKWDIKTGKYIKEYLGHEGSINSIFCNNNYIISASNDCTIRLWSEDHENCLDMANPFNHSIKCINANQNIIFAYSPDSRVINGWFVENDKLLSEIVIETQQNILDLKHKDNYLIIKSKSCFIGIYDLENPSDYKLLNNASEVIAIDINHNNIITCDRRYVVRMFDLLTGNKCKFTIELNEEIKTIIALNKVILFAGEDGAIHKILFEEENYEEPIEAEYDYFIIEEGIKKISVGAEKIICLSPNNQIKMFDIYDKEHEDPSYWKPKFIRYLNTIKN